MLQDLEAGKRARDRRPARRHARDRAQGRRARALHRKPVRPDPRARAIHGAVPMRDFALPAGFSCNACPSRNTTAPPSRPAAPTPSSETVRDGTRAKDIVFERDQNLQIERYTRKLGNQFVSSILRGNGAVVLDGAPSAELSLHLPAGRRQARRVLRVAAARQRPGARAVHARRRVARQAARRASSCCCRSPTTT